MKKRNIVVIAGVVVALAGGVMGCSSKENNDTVQETVAAVTKEPTVTDAMATETNAPGVEATDAAEQTAKPTEEVATEKPSATSEATPSATAAPTEAPKTDFSKLSDNELIERAVKQIKEENKQLTSEASLKKLTKQEGAVYTISVYESYKSKSLFDYLTSKDNVTAKYLSDSLEAIGAVDTKLLFDDFIGSMRIDVDNTTKLGNLKKSDYAFDIYDNDYKVIAKSEKLANLLADYIRKNVDALQLK